MNPWSQISNLKLAAYLITATCLLKKAVSAFTKPQERCARPVLNKYGNRSIEQALPIGKITKSG